FPLVEPRSRQRSGEIRGFVFTRVQDHEHRLSRQQAEAANELFLVWRDLERPEGLALVERGPETRQEVLLRLELGRLLLRDVLEHAVQPVRDDREIDRK